MKFLLEDDEIELKPILPISGVDAIVIPQDGRVNNSRGEGLGKLEKTLIILDEKDGTLTQKEIAGIHGVNQSTVSYISRGLASTNPTDVDETFKVEVLDPIEKTLSARKSDLIEKSSKKLDKLFDIFIPEKLEQNRIPSAMVAVASVMEKLAPKNPTEGITNNVQFIVMRPSMRKMEDFDRVQVSE